jgi:hypothetical protein
MPFAHPSICSPCPTISARTFQKKAGYPQPQELTLVQIGAVRSSQKSYNSRYPLKTSINDHYDRHSTVYNRWEDGRPPRLYEEGEERLVRSVRRERKKSAGFWGRRVSLSQVRGSTYLSAAVSRTVVWFLAEAIICELP